MELLFNAALVRIDCPLFFLWLFNRYEKGRSYWRIQINETRFRSNHRRCSLEKVFLEISQNSQENTCAIVFAGLRLATLLKKKFWHRCFPVDFAKFLRTPFVIEHLWWLLLSIVTRLCRFFSAKNYRIYPIEYT